MNNTTGSGTMTTTLNNILNNTGNYSTTTTAIMASPYIYTPLTPPSPTVGHFEEDEQGRLIYVSTKGVRTKLTFTDDEVLKEIWKDDSK